MPPSSPAQSTVCRLLQTCAREWVAREQENSQSLTKIILAHIAQVGKLREPQTQAIEIYLWIKFVGKNRKLAQLIKDGTLRDQASEKDYEGYLAFDEAQTTQRFLNQFFQDNNANNLQKELLNDPHGRNTDWDLVLEDLLHGFPYPNYLYSLPMGAGKTYLIACFIYLDLYFSELLKDDARFARNFIVFAPHASKTAILPSLRTIKDFNPEWILPKNVAQNLKQQITIEVLDALSSQRRDKLHGNNPNLEKVNRLQRVQQSGLVFITNAEKVVLEKYSDEDIHLSHSAKFGQRNLDPREQSALEKTNDLREALAKLPHLTVVLDEVHHTYGEQKIRQAVGILNKHGNINSVVGLSGTPYVTTNITLNNQKIRLQQIQDIVYNYPLNRGIGRFLKTPRVHKSEVADAVFLRKAMDRFFADYDRSYPNGTLSKIAFYCPSIATLNNEILPVIQDWYAEHRAGKEETEIFRYYTNVKSTDPAHYKLQNDSLATFNNLDQPHATARVVLLVAVGKEGWDCKSLTAVVLPRKPEVKSAKNFVLQTTCRCLREVENAATETAFIYLSPENYRTLDAELQANYHLSIRDIEGKTPQSIPVQIRKPRLGTLDYKQLKTRYSVVKNTLPNIATELKKFRMRDIKEKYFYNPDEHTAKIGKGGLQTDQIEDGTYSGNPLHSPEQFPYREFLRQLAQANYARTTESELHRKYGNPLRRIHREIASELEWIHRCPHLQLRDIINLLTHNFMVRAELKAQFTTDKTTIELLEWETDPQALPQIELISSSGQLNILMPKVERQNIDGTRGYLQHPEFIEEDCFTNGDADPFDISYNYVPYKMDSAFEQQALEEMLKMSELKQLEIYYNGYKDSHLHRFWIQTPHGRYTPDFLLLKRKGGKKYARSTRERAQPAIDKVLIIETKGTIYYNAEFQRKEEFVRNTFIQHNPIFRYHRILQSGDASFARPRAKLTEILQDF